MRLELRHYEAMVRLRVLPEFQVFMEILNSRAEALDRKLIMKDDVKVDLVRGELRAYVRIQDDLLHAPANLEKVKLGQKEHADGTP